MKNYSISGPYQTAIEALCRRDANLITAEATIKFLLDDLQSSHSCFNDKIKEAIIQRIVQERYTNASVILQCLHNLQAQLEKWYNKHICNYLLFRLIPELEDVEKLTMK